MIAIIGIVAGQIFFTVDDIRDIQQKKAEEIVKLKTVQDANTKNIGDIHNRVFNLEINNVEAMKKWTEDNYVRKPQR